MSDRALTQFADQSPPIVGQIPAIVTLAAGVASAAIDTGVDGSGASAIGPVFITLTCAAAFSIIFSGDGAVTALNAAPPVVATNTCIDYPAGIPVRIRISRLNRYFRAVSTAGGILKFYISSGPGN